MTAEKRAAIGVCDQCGGPIPVADHYTSKGRPRLHCSIDCRQTANSRAGAPIRSRKARARIARGEWTNPADIHHPDPANISAGVSRARKAEVREGRWRNPALAEAAKRKLSRPRKHTGALARAIDKARTGGMASLTPSEHRAYLAWRRELRQARADAIRRYQRERYHRLQQALTVAERQAQRERWRAQNRNRQRRKRGSGEREK